jgi:Dihydroorotase and related cyclic amidohydrolases
MKIVRRMGETPRLILGIEGGIIEAGAVADLAIVDLNKEWTVEPKKLHSKSKNTCFKGMMFKGKTKYTIVNGKVVYEDDYK